MNKHFLDLSFQVHDHLVEVGEIVHGTFRIEIREVCWTEFDYWNDEARKYSIHVHAKS